MRKFLLTVFWITNLGSVIQLLIIVSASWIILSGANSFFDLTVDVFITQHVSWMLWIKTILIHFLGDFGYLILTIPILIIAPLKLAFGTMISVWVYSVAMGMPDKPANSRIGSSR
jgi:hypothetical protein